MRETERGREKDRERGKAKSLKFLCHLLLTLTSGSESSQGPCDTGGLMSRVRGVGSRGSSPGSRDVRSPP